jgi:hypothetical protein
MKNTQIDRPEKPSRLSVREQAYNHIGDLRAFGHLCEMFKTDDNGKRMTCYKASQKYVAIAQALRRQLLDQLERQGASQQGRLFE